ncbi:hypothetical protein ACJJTC_007478 [Scirpophaga incertulas]
MLPYDHPAIGLMLIHIHMFSIATGTVPLPYIIAGEYSHWNTVAWLEASAYFSSVVGYCLTVAGIFLPETKDRTLQDIEDEFRGRPLSPEELKSVQSLTSLKLYNRDRRCSSPVI